MKSGRLDRAYGIALGACPITAWTPNAIAPKARHKEGPPLALLDDLVDEQLWRILGEPARVIRYAEPFGHWHERDQRPALADERPAVMQAIGRCAAARIRAVGSIPLAGPIHPAPCSWCGFPLRELLAACDWAVGLSRYVLVDLLVWQGADDSVYIRNSGRAGHYEEQSWAAFWALGPSERARRIETAITASQAGLAA
jgi:hypothetical protein